MPIASLIPTSDEFCVLRSQVADTLLACRDGDSALLYLYLVRKGAAFSEQQAMRDLGMARDRYERAVHTLTNLNLVQDQTTPDKPVQQETDKPPRYSMAEIRARREGDHRFASVCTTAEAVLGRPYLTESQLRTLMTAYEYLELPADVLIDMLMYLKREKGLVSRRDIEEEAFLWADMGIFTAKQATVYLARREEEKPILNAMLRALDMAGRDPAPKEYRILSEFIRKGFDADAVGLAKERMYQRIGDFKWSYLRGILNGWDAKGVHTVSEITAIEPNQRTPNNAAAVTPQNPERDSGNMQDWEREWLQQFEAMKQEEHADGI